MWEYLTNGVNFELLRKEYDFDLVTRGYCFYLSETLFLKHIMNHHLKKITVGFILWFLTGLVVVAEADAGVDKKTEQKGVNPEFKVSAEEVKMPTGITVNRVSREVHIDAEVCLDVGILEYVVCKPDSFEHESIFTTTAKPELVHAALLLCGMKPTPQLRGMTEVWTEKALKQKLSRIKIEVEWEEKGKKKRVNLTSLLKDREDVNGTAATAGSKVKRVSKVQDAWIFSGSMVVENTQTGKPFYAANASGILVGIWPDPSTVIQYGVVSGNPYEGEHLGVEINEKNIPKVETKVKLIFSQYKVPITREEPER